MVARDEFVATISEQVKWLGIGKMKALCPFHFENTPSFLADPKKQEWYCFGCGRGGTLEDFRREMGLKIMREGALD